jgi:hypothetical protein
MKDKFYADNRDLVKWAVLHRLAEIYKAHRILQLAFYRPSKFAKIKLNETEHDIPQEILSHFRDLRTIENLNSEIGVTVFCDLFENRDNHLEAIKDFLSKFQKERCVVFLDPDTGLEPHQNLSLKHVTDLEAKNIWMALKPGDVFVFYQHQTNRAGQPWIEPKKRQLENALENSVKVACGLEVAHDVVFFYAQKS